MHNLALAAILAALSGAPAAQGTEYHASVEACWLVLMPARAPVPLCFWYDDQLGPYRSEEECRVRARAMVQIILPRLPGPVMRMRPACASKPVGQPI